MLLLEYYGLNEQPFGVTPDPRFLYCGVKHREALASLLYGTESDRGFIALIAKPGMGKTSILYTFLEKMRDKARTGFLFQTDCHRRELLRHILTDLSLDATGMDLPAMHDLLNKTLVKEMNAGRRVILVIDEAQNLEEKALESIRLLSNFETPWAKLVQIIIAGQPQLADRLAKPSLAQLRQRISMIVRIEPFRFDEVSEYIRHRLAIAGYKGPSLFTAGAEAMIAERSEGIPRNINNICFNAMSIACAMKEKTITRNIVDEALTDLDLEPLSGEQRSNCDQELRRIVAKASLGSIERSHHAAWFSKVAAASVLFFALSGPLNISTTATDSTSNGDDTAEIRSLTASEKGVPAILNSADALFGASASLTTEGAKVQDQMPVPAVRNDPGEVGAKLSGAVRTIRVLPGQTIYRISVQNYGTYDDATLRSLRQLNPWLVDPTQVETGQTIVVPAVKQDSKFGLADGKRPSGIERSASEQP